MIMEKEGLNYIIKIIIKEVNLALLDQLLKGSDIKFPCGMGRIELRKYRTIIKFIEHICS